MTVAAVLACGQTARSGPVSQRVHDTGRCEFANAYHDVDNYLQQEYVPAGHFEIRDGSDVTIAIRAT